MCYSEKYALNMLTHYIPCATLGSGKHIQKRAKVLRNYPGHLYFFLKLTWRYDKMRLKDTGLTAQDIKDKVNKYMIETYERFDFLAETAKDMYIYDEEGTPYLDFYAGIAVNSAGSCNEKVVAAVIDQTQDIMHTFNYPYTIPQALLAEKICTTIGMDKIFYQNSGTEANEAMIKMARKYGVEKYGPHKYNIITAEMSFHGRTFGAMSATGQPDNACQIGFGGMVPGFTYAPYNDLEAFKAAYTENTIAIMIEPVQGEGGVHPATQEFMQGLRDFCDEKGILLLLDEVQTGWCRTGKVMSYMNYGITPDIVSMAKALGGGMPIGAICAKAEVAKAFTAGSHGTTFGGHPVSCAAALAEVDELLSRDLAGNAKKMGDYFMAKLAKLPHVKEVRGQGLLVGVEFDDSVNGVDVKHGCFDRKLLITAIGAHTIRMVPPLILTEADCDKAYDIIEETVKSL
jgi:acetylornithine/N-succinyldiaminopimelate aminotransferase